MKTPKESPLKQIRKQCLYCMGGSTKSVRFCHSINCPLWYLRFGKYPATVIRKNGRKFGQLLIKTTSKKRENLFLTKKFLHISFEDEIVL